MELVLCHIAPRFNRWLDALDDPRVEGRCTYPIRHVLWTGLLMFLCGMKSRYQLLSDGERVGFHRNLLLLADCENRAACHAGTLNHLVVHMAPSELIGLNAKLAHRIIDARCFEGSRLDPDPPDVGSGRQRQWLVAVDGTELYTYDTRHCKHCLVRTLSNGKKQYFHAVLEARLITAIGVTVSLCSVPIQNENREYDKQDCELKAFPRLAAELKKRFPRLRICLLGDSLYGCEPFFDICRDMQWDYIAVFKEGRTPALWKRAVAKRDMTPENSKTVKDKAGRVKRFTWSTCLEHGSHTVHAAFCEETAPKGRNTHWAWLTSHRPADYNIVQLTDKGGRRRWKIENECFNLLKNGETGLKHDYGSVGNAWYNYYLLAQIALLIIQLIWHSDIVRKVTDHAYESAKRMFRSIRNLVKRLDESLQKDRLGDVDDGFDPARIQIRFDTS